MLSCIIPSWKDPLIHKTIDSLLANSQGDIEIIPVVDGYKLQQPFVSDARVKPLILTENRGMRGAINAGVNAATGDHLMRTDEHCMFGKGFDRIILETIQPNWIVVPTRFFLDPIKWEVMDIPPVEYERLKIIRYEGGHKFSGIPTRPPTQDMIYETQAMQGSCWFMPHKWWDDVIVELQTEGYGPHYQDSHEMVFKTWKAGGKLMANRNTWYAHKHRDFPRTHHEGTKMNPAKREQGWKYSLETWEGYYNEWLVGAR